MCISNMAIELDNHLRTIAHFDLDAFYVACERELNPVLLNVPVAVSQYNPHGNLHETHKSEVDRRLVARPGISGQSKVHGDKNGSMIAVSYEARGKGVKRGDRGLDAVKKCPDLRIVQVPVKRGKADLEIYRNASNRVMDTLVSSLLNDYNIIPGAKLKRGDIKVEKASIDEIYIDLSVPVNEMSEILISYQKDGNLKGSNSEKETGFQIWEEVQANAKGLGSTTIGGIETMSSASLALNQLSKDEVRKGSQFQVHERTLDSGSKSWWERSLEHWTEVEIRLACGSALAAKARHAVQKKFERNNCHIFTLSGGISSNKTLAKLASGLKKPNRQTLINPMDVRALSGLFHPLNISRIRGLGGKFGVSVQETLGVITVGDLAKVPLTRLKDQYPPSPEDERPTADFLYTIAKGICKEEVSERTVEKSISSGKTFRGALAIAVTDTGGIQKWLSELVGGLLDRLTITQEDNKRIPTTLALSIKIDGDGTSTSSKSKRAPQNISEEAYLEKATQLYQEFKLKQNAMVTGITVTASNFNEIASGESSIIGAFKRSNHIASQTPPSQTSTRTTSTKRLKKTPLLNMWKKASESDKRRQEAAGEITPRSQLEHIDSHIDKNCEGARANENSSVPRSLKFTSAIQNTDVDKSVFSQLPMSIQSEIRVASMSKVGGISRKKKDAGRNMKSWLLGKSSLSTASTASTTRQYFAEVPQKGKHVATSEKQTQFYKHSDIDPEVFAELPFHIQAMVRKQIRPAKTGRKL